MRILYVLPESGVAGGASQVFEHVNRLQERGHEVHLATMGWEAKQPDWYPLRVEIKPIGKIKELAEHMDVIVATHYITAFYVAELETTANKYYFIQHKESLFVDDKSFVTVNFKGTKDEESHAIRRHRDEYREYIEKTYKLGLKPLVTSDWLKTWLKEDFGQEATQIYCCLNEDIFYPEATYPKGDKVRVLLETTAQKTSWKGVEDAKEVLEGDPELRSKIEVWTLSADEPIYVGDKHWRRPPQEEIRKIYSSCDINLKMSWYEGWGLGPMQAMACGCAVVSSDNWGINTYAKNDENALITPNKDIEAARDALKRLVEDVELRQKLIEKGMNINKEFNFDKEIDKLEEQFGRELRFGPLTQLKDVMEYFGEPQDIALDKINRAERLVEQLWVEKNPQTVEEIEAFYKETDMYIYNLAWVGAMSFKRTEAGTILDFMKKYKSTRHLDFGGGIGDLSIYLSREATAELHYYDLPGKLKEFAKWRFKKHNLNIAIDDQPSGKYDTMTILDVLEHVPYPIEIVRGLLKYLNKGGALYITAPFFATKSAGFNYPMHLESNRKYEKTFDEILKTLGLEKISEFEYRYNGTAGVPRKKLTIQNNVTNEGITLTYRDGAFDMCVLEEMFKEQTYQKNGFGINDSDVVIDIGGHIGSFAVWAGKQAKKLYTYEPFSENFELLQENLAQNNMTNVEAFNLGIWGEECDKELGIVAENLGANSLYTQGQYQPNYTETIRCIPLRKVFDDNRIEMCNLLKLDCEGAEYEILYNLPNEYYDKIEKIILEFHEHKTDPTFKHDTKELESFLKARFKEVEVKYLTGNVGFIKASK